MTPYKTIHFCMIGALNSNVIYILHFLKLQSMATLKANQDLNVHNFKINRQHLNTCRSKLYFFSYFLFTNNYSQVICIFQTTSLS